MTTLPLVLLVACAPATTYVTTAPGPGEVSVTGTARIDLAPDESCIELTLSVRNESISVAHEELMMHIGSLIETLHNDDALRVERGAIRYAPQYEEVRSRRPRQIVGHIATAQLNVRTQDFERIPDVVAQAAIRGLERVDVVFYSTELVAQKAALRRQALEAARDKANDMAETLDANIGVVRSIREAGASTNTQIAVVNYVVSPLTDALPSQPPQPGSIPLTISVDVVYALRE